MKILIADDEPTDRMVLRQALMKLSYEVEVAHNGAQAWQALQREDGPCLAILDWIMPGLTGPEVCRKVRASPRRRYVYLILLTALDRVDDLVEGMEAGADDYITKPFKAAELNARLRAGGRILELERNLLEAQKELEVRATHDGLTGALNHVAILDLLKHELERIRRQKSSLGVILLDLDHFKKVNDFRGHSVGDQVLRDVTLRIRGALRSYDLLGRYGGEEFLVITPGCDLPGTLRVAERIRQAVAAGPMALQGDTLTVTISAGVAATSANLSADGGELVQRADRALYQAKGAGRNRVMADGDPEPAANSPAAIAPLQRGGT